MRICHLSWEYPPVVYGGLGRHVFAIAREQVRAGHEVIVISHVGINTDDGSAQPSDEILDGVRVIRVVRDAPYVEFEPVTLLGWVSGLSSAMIRAAVDLRHEWDAEVIHAHDWLTAHAGAAVSRVLGVPWIHTIHATEAGRHQGWLPGPLSHAIHSIEGWSVHRADRVLVCSAHMRWEVERLFGMPDAIVIPNGVDTSAALVDTALCESIRADYPGLLLVHTGRLEWEKGAHTIIEALPRLKRRFPDLNCVIAGRGSQSQSLAELAKRKRVASRVHLEGWLPEAHLRALVAAADVAVVPSLYEPFGIVALEAASVKTPVVAARSGGLIEFLDDDAHGWGFEPGVAGSLADAVRACVADPVEARRRAGAAYAHVRSHHSWAAIAQRTVDRYTSISPQRRTGTWEPVHISPEQNLLFDAR